MADNKQSPEPLFKELDGFIQEEEYLKVTKTCDKILAMISNDPDAIKCKIIAFIKLNQCSNALQVIDGCSSDKKLYNDLLFEKGYCLYRTKKYNEALEVIKSINKPHPARVLELEAQVRYRLEHYKQCIAIYQDLSTNHDVDSSELKTNLCAAYTEAGMTKENLFFVEKNKGALQETFEFAFNAACAYIAIGDYVKSETLLQLAKKVCAESLADDGYSATEIQQELAVIQVQLAYCQQLAGQLEQANNLYLDVIKTKSSDQVAIAVATNNSITIKKASQDPFDSTKRLRNATSDVVEQKLTPSQRKTVAFNKAILTLHTSKGDQVRAALDQLEKEGTDEEGVILLKASLLVKEKQSGEAEKLLAEYAKKHPQSLRVPLSLAQVYLSKNEFAPTLAVLQGLSEELRFKPAMVATITALYEKAGDIDGAVNTLDKYVEWAEKQKDRIDGEELARILRVNGEFKLQHKRYEQAYEVFEKVLKKNRNDMKAVAQLVIAASHFNPSLATKYEERIPSSEDNNNNINIDELEKMAAPSLRGKSKQDAPAALEEPKQLKKKANKKKRKPRLPKNINPSVTPDPERWLPKWQRSYYKKKQKKNVLAKGSQGLAGNTPNAPVPLAAPSSSKPAAAAAKAPPAKKGGKKGRK